MVIGPVRAFAPVSNIVPLSCLRKPFVVPSVPPNVNVWPAVTSTMLFVLVAFWKLNVRLVAKVPVARKVDAAPLPMETVFPMSPSAPSEATASTPPNTFSEPLKVLPAFPKTTAPAPVFVKPAVPLMTPFKVNPCTRLEALTLATLNEPPVTAKESLSNNP